MVIALCSVYTKNELNKDGSTTEKSYLPVLIAADHRYVDGVLASKIMKEVLFKI